MATKTIEVIENGVQYTLTESEVKAFGSYLYYCDECKAHHVNDENLEIFLEKTKVKTKQ